MTDRRQISELHDRRQVHDRINELKSSCENLTQIRENLLGRLNELNEVADRLIDEKNNQHDALMRNDPVGVMISHASIHQTRDRQKFTSATNDLNYRYKSSSRRENETIPSHKLAPSNAFKMKLSLCLHEVVHKAEEIVELSLHLPSRNDTF